MHYHMIIRLSTLLLPWVYGQLVEPKTEPSDAADVWPEIQYSGPYGIRHCGSNATKIDAALKTLRHTLQPAIRDSTQIPLSPAYKTFFKNAVHSQYIKGILSNITTGVQMPLKAAGQAHSNAPGSGEIQRSPEIICISRRGQLLYNVPNHNGVVDHYDACEERTDGGTSAYMAGTQYIVLCPSFFALEPAPSEPNCPRINKWANRYSDSYGGKSIIHFQIFALLHGIAQFYIFATSAGPRAQANGINECSRLTAEYARENARSYEFYVANIRSNCTNFPKAYDASGRELLGEDPAPGNLTEGPDLLWISDIDLIDTP